MSWLTAWDLLQAHGAAFDAPFEETFARGVCAHGRHIAGNLEWYPHLLANHYLSDVAGLLFVAAYLPCAPETDGWLALASREFVAEIRHQFGLQAADTSGETPGARGAPGIAGASPLRSVPGARLYEVRKGGGERASLASDADDRLPDRFESAAWLSRTALCVEVRDPRRASGPEAEDKGEKSGVLYVFMPPLGRLDQYLALVSAVEATAARLHRQVLLEGYPPPATTAHRRRAASGSPFSMTTTCGHLTSSAGKSTLRGRPFGSGPILAP